MNLVKEYLTRCKRLIINTKLGANVNMRKIINIALVLCLMAIPLGFPSNTGVASTAKENEAGLVDKNSDELQNTKVTDITNDVSLTIESETIIYEPLLSASVENNEAKIIKVKETKEENGNVEAETDEPEKQQRENTLYYVLDDGYRFDLDDKYQDYLWEQCKERGIEKYYKVLLAQMYHESAFNISVISRTNDYGLMQINICNHEWLGKVIGDNDFLNPYTSIRAGVYLMSDFLNRYNDVQKALVCYNRGENAVKKGTYSTGYSQCVVDDIKLLVER